MIYISAWGFGVARFDYDGQFSGASNREASDSAGLHVFFMPKSKQSILINTPVAVVLDRKTLLKT